MNNLCQSCGSINLKEVFNAGLMPLVNTMREIGSTSEQEVFYPTVILECQKCKLVQMGQVPDKEVIFPPSYSYRSKTTKLLRDNFKELFQQVDALFPHFGKGDVVCDVGGNDGELLSNFNDAGFYCINIEPTGAAEDSKKRGIPTINKFFSKEVVEEIVNNVGKADIITCTNCFAHMPNIHEVIDNILVLLDQDGIFVCENHYLLPLIEDLQYDCYYAEHQRFYSLTSLMNLLEPHGLEVFQVEEIPTHGGSFRSYIARKGSFCNKPDSSVEVFLHDENNFFTEDVWKNFRQKVARSKLELWGLLAQQTIDSGLMGVGCPSRAVVLVNFLGLDENILDCVVEVPGSPKLGHYVPGTRIPIHDEKVLYEEQPEYALLLSWHIADELMKNLRAKGFRGKFITPLPEPKIME